MGSGDIFRKFKDAPDTKIPVTHRTVTVALLRHLKIREGHYQLLVGFERSGQNIEWKGQFIPCCIVALEAFGLMRVPTPSPMSVDAATVWDEATMPDDSPTLAAEAGGQPH